MNIALASLGNNSLGSIDRSGATSCLSWVNVESEGQSVASVKGFLEHKNAPFAVSCVIFNLPGAADGLDLNLTLTRHKPGLEPLP